ncbi:unnamed protein product [Caenorhabditis auriculariae]|uniref:tryptophan--tRNA ligase n=1 Tax=Caenorhabditis auriculariae TaxID=2777116 RepID=A0A8S1H203_9PELO|nr:unnamed protein product [Caenorhabditis auriculariae]
MFTTSKKLRVSSSQISTSLVKTMTTSSSNPGPSYFSGIQPTGIPHLGNYFGFIEPWIQFQKTLPKSTCMILSVVDQHAISLGPKNPEQLRSDTRRMATGLVACGVDPSRTLLFRQSDVPQIAQLSWILGSLQTSTKLMRLPQYKDKASKKATSPSDCSLIPFCRPPTS